MPVRFVLNESNSGSPFRQWLKGIDLARGDLVWIAESDDTCRPELLERLVARFDDPDVMLAYCQSAMIGPDGRPFAADYLAATEDLSPVRWRYPYCVPGHEEVERALSQRNTIPNASAVLFRKPARIEERADLETLRLSGDWLFYAMRIRRGKIAYVPEPLNGHRHHGGTVRSAFERAVELFEEQLQVKARIFESFPVTAGAIASSLARGFAEYVDRTRGLGPHPAMTEHPRLAPHLDRLRNLFRARLPARQDVRVLIVLSGVTDGPGARRDDPPGQRAEWAFARVPLQRPAARPGPRGGRAVGQPDHPAGGVARPLALVVGRRPLPRSGRRRSGVEPPRRGDPRADRLPPDRRNPFPGPVGRSLARRRRPGSPDRTASASGAAGRS